jgi:hypothetical protein
MRHDDRPAYNNSAQEQSFGTACSHAALPRVHLVPGLATVRSVHYCTAAPSICLPSAASLGSTGSHPAVHTMLLHQGTC